MILEGGNVRAEGGTVRAEDGTVTPDMGGTVTADRRVWKVGGSCVWKGDGLGGELPVAIRKGWFPGCCGTVNMCCGSAIEYGSAGGGRPGCCNVLPARLGNKLGSSKPGIRFEVEPGKNCSRSPICIIPL